MVKNLPTNAGEERDKQIQSLGWEDTLEKEMATHSSTLAWRIPWTEEPGGLRSCKESDLTEQLSTNQTQINKSLNKWTLSKADGSIVKVVFLQSIQGLSRTKTDLHPVRKNSYSCEALGFLFPLPLLHCRPLEIQCNY